MNWKKSTIIFIVVAVIAIFGYDALTIVQGGLETSISHTLIVWSYEFPVITFSFGFVMGHLFWRLRDSKSTKQITEFLDRDSKLPTDIK